VLFRSHDAIGASEAGADYVAFAGPDDVLEELLAWWQETMTPPCVAVVAGDLEGAIRLARTGADFLALDDAIWNHPEGPAAAVAMLVEGLG
jgi:thiamine-phosphate pyrophosphorylase